MLEAETVNTVKKASVNTANQTSWDTYPFLGIYNSKLCNPLVESTRKQMQESEDN